MEKIKGLKGWAFVFQAVGYNAPVRAGGGLSPIIDEEKRH
jgi:hypothetical protein